MENFAVGFDLLHRVDSLLAYVTFYGRPEDLGLRHVLVAPLTSVPDVPSYLFIYLFAGRTIATNCTQSNSESLRVCFISYLLFIYFILSINIFFWLSIYLLLQHFFSGTLGGGVRITVSFSSCPLRFASFRSFFVCLRLFRADPGALSFGVVASIAISTNRSLTCSNTDSNPLMESLRLGGLVRLQDVRRKSTRSRSSGYYTIFKLGGCLFK